MRSLAVGLFATLAEAACEMAPGRLRVNSLENPLGVPDGAPVFSWALEATSSPPARGLSQSAYQLTVSSKPGGSGDLWDSGKVTSAESLQIPYDGKPLLSSQRAHWSVSVWDASGEKCSAPTADAVAPKANPPVPCGTRVYFDTGCLCAHSGSRRPCWTMPRGRAPHGSHATARATPPPATSTLRTSETR